MRPSISAFLLSAVVLCAAVPSAHAQVHFQCTQGTIDVNESAGQVSLELTRDGDLSLWAQAAFSVEEQTGPGTWTSVGNHYWTALFAPGSNLASVAVPMNDAVYTGDRLRRAICFGFLTPNGGGSSVGNVFINIHDDEPFPTITRPDFVVQEGDPDPPYVSVSVPFTLSGPFGRTMSLRAYGYSGTASYSDFGVTTDFTIQPNTTNAWLTIHIAHDDLAEDDEMFEVRIVENETVRKTFTVTILDDDSAPFPVSFNQAQYVFDEGGSNSVTVTRGGNTAVAGAGTLHVESLTPEVWPDVAVAFAAGQASKTVDMPFNDHAFGGNRTGMLQFIAPNGFVAAEAPVAMNDDDPMPVLSIAGGEVLEGASGETNQAEVTLTLTAPLAVDLQFNVVTVNGTATSDDYTALEKKVFFAPGSLSTKVAVTIRGDDAPEVDETFRVEIQHCCSSLAFVDQYAATITIRNDDSGNPGDVPPSYRFVRPLSRVWNESQQWLQATVVRSGSGIDRAASVTVRLQAGPARKFDPREVRFRRGETQAVARFYIDDPFYSGTSSGTIELFASAVRQDQDIINIIENEAKPVITFTDGDVTEGDADVAAAVVVTVTPPSFLPIDAKFALSAFGASLTRDISGIRDNQQYTIPALRSTVTIPFYVTGDNDREPTEAFGFALRAIDPALASVRGSATCTIHDDDTPGATLTLPPGLARGATATITFTLSSPAPFDETFAVSTTTPELLSVPSSVQVRWGASTAAFEVSALAPGNAAVSVKLTPRLGSNSIADSLVVYRLVTPILPERVRVPVGTTVLAKVALSETIEGEVQLALASDDPSIAATALSDVLGTDSSMLAIHGVSIGTTRLAVTMPAELGGTTAYLPVEVYEPVAERKRAARH
jgi:hypothetical protein